MGFVSFRQGELSTWIRSNHRYHRVPTDQGLREQLRDLGLQAHPAAWPGHSLVLGCGQRLPCHFTGFADGQPARQVEDVCKNQPVVSSVDTCQCDPSRCRPDFCHGYLRPLSYHLVIDPASVCCRRDTDVTNTTICNSSLYVRHIPYMRSESETSGAWPSHDQVEDEC